MPSPGERVRCSFAAHKGKTHGLTGGLDGWGDHYLLKDRTQESGGFTDASPNTEVIPRSGALMLSRAQQLM